MSDRYGKTRVAKIKAAYDDLREAVRAHDTEAAEAALDRYEQWADYVFYRSKAQDERDLAIAALFEARDLILGANHASTRYPRAFEILSGEVDRALRKKGGE